MRRAASVALAALYASLAWAAPEPATPAAATFKDPLVDVITALKPASIQAGECLSYANGTANAVLCLQKATTTPADTVLVRLQWARAWRDGGGEGVGKEGLSL